MGPPNDLDATMGELSFPLCLVMERRLLAKIQRAPFKSRQRVWGCLISLCRHGVYTDCGKSVRLDESWLFEGWTALVCLVDFDPLKLGGDLLWWRIDSIDDGRRVVRLSQNPSEINEGKQATTPDPFAQKLVELNPLEYWVRSPEQASLRRAILTQQEKAILLSAPRGSGATLGLASAVADWLSANRGECIFVTRSASKVRAMIEALSHQVHRVHIMTPSDLCEALLSHQGLQVETNDNGRGPSMRQGLSETTQGGLLADALSTAEWDRWTSWSELHQDRLGPWVDWLGALRRLILKRIVILGAPAQHASSLRERLDDLPNNWRDGLLQLGQSVWESSLLETLRGLEQLPSVDWPWPNARALVVDDCLSLPWQLIYKTLTFADEHLGASGRRWTLMLSSGGEGGISSSGVSLNEIETLVSGVLGWQLHRLRLSHSQRLPRERTLSVRRLIEPWISSGERRGGAFNLPSNLLSSSAQESQSPLLNEPLWHVSQFGEERVVFKSCLQACLMTPGAYILDLSPRPLSPLYVDSELTQELAEELFRHESLDPIALQARLNAKIVHATELENLEVQWLIIYRGQSLSTRQELIPEVIRSLEMTDIQGLLYLLNRCPTPLIWLGDLPIEITTEEVNLEACLEIMSIYSPGGGVETFERLRLLRGESALSLDREQLESSLKDWRSLSVHLSRAFGDIGRREAQASVLPIYHSLMTSQLSDRDWVGLQATLQIWLSQTEALISNHKDELTPLPKPFSSELQALIAGLFARGEATFENEKLEPLFDVILQLQELTRLPIAPHYYSQLRDRCWRWSERALSLPIPQAQVQSALLALLSEASPHCLEYRALSEAYQAAPKPLALTQIAYMILSESSPRNPHEIARHQWTLRHLNRWIMFLLEPRAQSPKLDLSEGTVIMGFALIAAQGGEWTLSETLMSLPLLNNRLHPLDLRWSDQSDAKSEQDIEDEQRRRHWREERDKLFNQRGSYDELIELREHGELTEVIKRLEAQGGKIPPNLLALRNAKIAIQELERHWSSLYPAERSLLEMSWAKLTNQKG